jgi:hypothetical protein
VRHRLGEQRLAGSRRPVQQDPLRHARATTSRSSSLASSTPATSSQPVESADCGLISVGFILKLGMNRSIRTSTTAISPMKRIGSQTTIQFSNSW